MLLSFETAILIAGVVDATWSIKIIIAYQHMILVAQVIRSIEGYG